MSKEQKSKLDAHAERLEQWFGVDKLTLEQVQAQLLSDGIKVSTSRLSEWWQSRQSQLMQEKLLMQIATGAAQCKAVEQQFATNPAPAVATIISLNRVLVMELMTKGQADYELLKLADQMTRTALDFISGQTKADLEKQKINLASRRVKLLEAKAAAYDKLKAASASGGITPETLKAIEGELKLL